MTARDKLTEYAASWIADCGESYDAADAHAAQLVQEFRTELAEEFAAALLAVDPVEWALAGQHAGRDAAALVRRVAATPTSKEQKR